MRGLSDKSAMSIAWKHYLPEHYEYLINILGIKPWDRTVNIAEWKDKDEASWVSVQLGLSIIYDSYAEDTNENLMIKDFHAKIRKWLDAPV